MLDRTQGGNFMIFLSLKYYVKCRVCHFNTFRGSIFLFHEFLLFLKAEISQINKIQSPKNGKNGSFRLSRFSKIDTT